MMRIRISPPAGGPRITAARGQTVSVVVRGSYRSDDDPAVQIMLTVSGTQRAAAVDTATRRWQATVDLTGPSRVRLRATMSGRERDAQGQWRTRTLLSPWLLLIASDPQDDPIYRMSGVVVDSRGTPLGGLQVSAFDLDRRSQADPLGKATSDDEGSLFFEFRESDFTESFQEGGPDVVFVVRQGARELPSTLVGRRGNWMPGATPLEPPFTLRVANLLAPWLSPPVRQRWLANGGSRGFLGAPLSDESALSRGARIANFAGGSIVVHPEFGPKLVYGLIRARWQALGADTSRLGLPVSDELDDPAAPGARIGLFERGVVRWRPGQAQAQEAGHDHLRIHGQLRAQILSRFFLVGRGGRRNHLSMFNQLDALPPAPGSAPPEDDERARWRIAIHCGENPFMSSTNLVAMLAVEEQAGNAESRLALGEWLATTRSLGRWTHLGPQGDGRLPLRWDPGCVLDTDDPRQQFVPRGSQWQFLPPPNDMHLQPARPIENLVELLGPRAGNEYFDRAAGTVSNHYRRWELSMDELTGLVTSYWLISRLVRERRLRDETARQADAVGHYLADHGWMLVRPQGGFSWQGYGETLPAMEFPLSRALAAAAGQTTNYAARADIQQVLTLAGHWDQLAGPVNAWQAGSWVLTLAGLPASPLAVALGVTGAAATLVFGGQLLSPGQLGAAGALYLHRDAFDVLLSQRDSANGAGVAIGSLLLATTNKALVFRNLTQEMAARGGVTAWAAYFAGIFGITGLDDPDPTVRDAYGAWFAARQANPQNEHKGTGSRTLWAAAVRVLLLGRDTAAEARLVELLDRAVIELCRDRYFDPRPPALPMDGDGGEVLTCEFALLPWHRYGADPSTPYGPLDYLAAHALACWHARRRADAGVPVTIAGFPGALTAAAMTAWPAASIPQSGLDELGLRGLTPPALQGVPTPAKDGHGRYSLLVRQVARAQPQPVAWPGPNLLVCDVQLMVDAAVPGEVHTGVTAYPGFEFSIEASGELWAGRVLDPAHDAEGLSRLVHDARWPLHTGLDADANAFCLLGRLNGWFRVGNRLSRRRWQFPESRTLFLRINDGERVAGNGAWQVRIRVWGPAGGGGYGPVYRAPRLLDDGAAWGTSYPADLIEVSVVPAVVAPEQVRVELVADGAVNARKELRAIGGSAPAVTVFTENAVRSASIDLAVSDLPAMQLALSRRVFLGMVQVRLLADLASVPGGSLLRLVWVRD